MPSNLPTGPFEKLGILFKMTLSDVFFRCKLGVSTGIVLVFFWGGAVGENQTDYFPNK